MSAARESKMQPLHEQRIRLPFRILAGVLFVAALLALLASGYATFAHRSARHVLMVATTLPVFALFCRLAGFAAFRGRVPRDLYWPFADGRVAFAWIVLFAAVMHYATHDA